MSVPMELDDPATEAVPLELDDPAMEAVPLDLTMKKERCAVTEVAGSEKPTVVVKPLSQVTPNVQNNGKTTPLDLSGGIRALPAPVSVTVAQRATVVVLSPNEVVSPPPWKPMLKSETDLLRKKIWSPVDSSTRVAEKSVPPPGMYADVPYQPMLPSMAVPEYNPFLPVFMASATAQFNQQQEIRFEQQYQLSLQQQLRLQLQIQYEHQEQQQKLQKLRMQVAYGGLPLDPALLSNSPVYGATSSPSSSESSHFQFGGFDSSFPRPDYGFGYYDGRVTDGTFGGGDGSINRSDSPESMTTDDHHHNCIHKQQQREWDLENRIRSNTYSAMDEMDVVRPEEIAAIYRQSDFLSFRKRYMESLGPPKNFDKMRRSNNNNSFSHNNNNDDDDHRQSQEQCDQSYVIKRQKNNEAAKRSRDTKRQKYIENQISVMYLTKKVSELKEMKRRLLKSL